MDAESLRLAERLLPSTYIKQASDADISRRTKIHQLLEKRKCPDEGWDDQTIEGLLIDLAKMDSNNFPANCGVGEREARIYSGLVAQRHYRLGHGIGRSGDISEVQPKAAGSSLLNKLTNAMVLDLIRRIGIRGTQACLVMPMATGMTVMMTLLSLRDSRPQAKYVLWPRIDQKSCLKSISTAGFEVVVVENVLEGDEIRTDVPALKEKVTSLGAENVAAVLTTTSCFAPRGVDRLEEVAKICKEHNIPHVVNNAYGIQSTKCLHHIQQAGRVGRVDAFIQSTDKNFLVPVGGAVVAGFDAHFIEHIGKMYPGRASVSPVLDLFITLLSMGVQGYTALMTQRSQHMEHLRLRMGEVATNLNLKLLQTKNNPISIGLALPEGAGTELGSQLFLRGVSGVRVVTPDQVKVVAGVTLKGWGAHHPNYPHAYLTAAAALGMTRTDVDTFMARLEKCLKKMSNKLKETRADVNEDGLENQ
ncbi:O-phosphoseryl-tRNA(Sec) selenium transferase [Chionoecetes opilio]|uniref:O-phosphoseryl-tRNA(Sec) selenium transferase n=1 Tax=Chionoecetes opilio TaxID=41210 RepID=A0A8J4YGH9_CHIOP|nr:O-phosphoseryl-tRNA(Sec) selenium transferase [Chionoecetes opilio]